MESGLSYIRAGLPYIRSRRTIVQSPQMLLRRISSPPSTFNQKHLHTQLVSNQFLRKQALDFGRQAKKSTRNLVDFSLLGLDVSPTALGVARSDPGLSIAVPLIDIDRKKHGILEIITKLSFIKKEYDVKGLICGLPLSRDGRFVQACERAKYFAETIGQGLNLSVHYWDERYTTQQAKDAYMMNFMDYEGNLDRSVRSKRVANNRVKSWEGERARLSKNKALDSVAASICLQSYLDALDNDEGGLAMSGDDGYPHYL